jgi:CTP synthase (UTP-ammonia lyase)
MQTAPSSTKRCGRDLTSGGQRGVRQRRSMQLGTCRQNHLARPGHLQSADLLERHRHRYEFNAKYRDRGRKAYDLGNLLWYSRS